MREIKFRGWDGETKRMWAWRGLVDTHPLGCLYSHRDGSWEVTQYAGLEDKNGVEIYEGDIVEWNGIHYKVCIGEFGLRNLETESVVDMVYGVYGDPINESVAPFCYQVPINNTWIQHHHIHVIGNIYENPDLLTA